MPRQLSLHVVGAAYLNKRGGSDRRFEILLCPPGEPVELIPEPNNPADPQAVAVYSARGVQIGYLTAERAPWIGGMMRNGTEVRAIFQGATTAGAAIRVGLDGEEPVLPPAPATNQVTTTVSGPTRYRRMIDGPAENYRDSGAR